MTVARATVFYRTLYGRRKKSSAVRVLTQQHKRTLIQQRRQNNNIAEAIIHKSIRYNK